MAAISNSISLKFTRHFLLLFLSLSAFLSLCVASTRVIRNPLSGKMFAYSVPALKSPFRYLMLSSVDRRFFPRSNGFLLLLIRTCRFFLFHLIVLFSFSFFLFIQFSNILEPAYRLFVLLRLFFFFTSQHFVFHYIPLIIINDAFRPSNKHPVFTCRIKHI